MTTALYDGDLLSVAELLDNADPWWRSSAERALNALIKADVEFTTDDLRDMGVEDIDSPREQRSRWGSLIAAAKARRLIYEVYRRPSRRPEANGRKISVWRKCPDALVAA